MNIFTKTSKLLRVLRKSIRALFVEAYIDEFYGGFLQYRKAKGNRLTKRKNLRRYRTYLEKNGASIGVNAVFKGQSIFPHGLAGIHISDSAVIGKDCVIFQQVTIGSNMIKGHPRCGAPTIGDRVYIGAGAKIIGKITIGDNCRIGANCVVVTDMPPNSVAVLQPTRIITKDEPMDNTFYNPASMRALLESQTENNTGEATATEHSQDDNA